ncbi:MAG TPA: CidA/LrgA family holin-like protein [Virgibacillus sp.]|nr:CidA/LrgA family holin-like protein [Virgibacillus sp.]
MKYVYITLQVALLYVFYMIGSWLQVILDVSIPGSIIGMLLLFVVLCLKIFPLKWIEQGGQFLNAYLPVFFIPATVGVMNYFHVFKGTGMFLVLIIVSSTLIVMIFAGKTADYMVKRHAKDTHRIGEEN